VNFEETREVEDERPSRGGRRFFDPSEGRRADVYRYRLFWGSVEVRVRAAGLKQRGGEEEEEG